MQGYCNKKNDNSYPHFYRYRISQRTGLLSMLDVECSMRGTAESYVAKVRTQHKPNPRLLESRNFDCRSFGIQHFAGRVTYDATDFLGKFY